MDYRQGGKEAEAAALRHVGGVRKSSRHAGAARIVAMRTHDLRKEAIVRARQAEMFAQRRPFVVAPKQAAAL